MYRHFLKFSSPPSYPLYKKNTSGLVIILNSAYWNQHTETYFFLLLPTLALLPKSPNTAIDIIFLLILENTLKFVIFFFSFTTLNHLPRIVILSLKFGLISDLLSISISLPLRLVPILLQTPNWNLWCNQIRNIVFW